MCTHNAPPPPPLQVAVALAGRIDFRDNVTLTCPAGSTFVDMFGGLYGPGAYPSESVFCNSPTAGLHTQLLTSSLEFVCSVCDFDTYSVVLSSSNGSSSAGGGPAAATGAACLPCPSGASCTNGSVTPTPGYWGAGDMQGVVALALCPEDYCCDNAQWPCTGPSSCGGNREGPLCGDCKQGFAASIGSSECIQAARCASEQGYVWTAIVCGVFVAASVELLVVSGVWSTEDTFPKAKMKLAMYFAQVGPGSSRCLFGTHSSPPL
jgi:hypothetical protein